MKKKSEITLNPRQKLLGRVLLAFALIVGVLHLFQTYYMRYDSAASNQLMNAEFFLVGTLIALTTVYLLYSRCMAADTISILKFRIKALLLPEQVILIAFFAWILISCAAGNSILSVNAFEYNRSHLLDIAISFFILFPITAYMAGSVKKISQILVPALATILTAVMFYILWNVFQNNVMSTPNGGIGMTSRLNLVISTHYNTVGAYAVAAALICIALAFRTSRLFLKPIYVLFALVHWIILMLSQSRTSIISAVFTLSVGVFAILYFTLKKRVKLIPRIAICLIAAVVSGIVLMTSRQWVFTFFESISHLSELLAAQGTAHSTDLREIEFDGNVASRMGTWMDSLKIMTLNTKYFMFGTTPVGVIPMLDKIAGANYGWYTHNQFLEMGVAFGVPGMLMYTVWLVLVARSCLRIGLNRAENVSLADRVVPLIILSLVVSNLTEGMLVGYTYMPGSVFFILSGWVCVKARTLPPVSVKELL